MKACVEIASMMMNATLDLLVVYEVGKKTYAKALECKYTSDEGTYKDVAGAEYPMQLFIQECVMSFLFGKRKNPDGTDDTDGIEKHIPQHPSGSKIWKNKEPKWKDICEYVYEGVLKQPRDSEDVANAGVEMIRFAPVKKSEDAIIMEIKNIITERDEGNRTMENIQRGPVRITVKD